MTAAWEERVLALRKTVARFDTLCANEKEHQTRLGAIERKPDKQRYARRNSPGALG